MTAMTGIAGSHTEGEKERENKSMRARASNILFGNIPSFRRKEKEIPQSASLSSSASVSTDMDPLHPHINPLTTHPLHPLNNTLPAHPAKPAYPVHPAQPLHLSYPVQTHGQQTHGQQTPSTIGSLPSVDRDSPYSAKMYTPRPDRDNMAALDKRERDRLTDKSWVLIPVLVQSEPCRRCGQFFDAELNDSTSCVYHADREGKTGEYKTIPLRANGSYNMNNNGNSGNSGNNGYQRVGHGQQTHPVHGQGHLHANTLHTQHSHIHLPHHSHPTHPTHFTHPTHPTHPAHPAPVPVPPTMMWTCCHSTDEHASGCFSRPHICKDVMMSVRAEGAPSVRIENIEMSVLSTLEISIFPGAVTSWLQVRSRLFCVIDFFHVLNVFRVIGLHYFVLSVYCIPYYRCSLFHFSDVFHVIDVFYSMPLVYPVVTMCSMLSVHTISCYRCSLFHINDVFYGIGVFRVSVAICSAGSRVHHPSLADTLDGFNLVHSP